VLRVLRRRAIRGRRPAGGGLGTLGDDLHLQVCELRSRDRVAAQRVDSDRVDEAALGGNRVLGTRLRVGPVVPLAARVHVQFYF